MQALQVSEYAFRRVQVKLSFFHCHKDGHADSKGWDVQRDREGQTIENFTSFPLRRTNS